MSQTESEWPWTPRGITDGVQLGLSKGPWTPRCITDGVQGALPGPPWTPRCITESVMQKSSGGGTCHRRSPRALDSKHGVHRPDSAQWIPCSSRFRLTGGHRAPRCITDGVRGPRRGALDSEMYSRRSRRGPGLRDVFQTESEGPWTPRCITGGAQGALVSRAWRLEPRSAQGPTHLLSWRATRPSAGARACPSMFWAVSPTIFVAVSPTIFVVVSPTIFNIVLTVGVPPWDAPGAGAAGGA